VNLMTRTDIAGGWEIPVPVGAAPVLPPPFPVEVFPAWLGEMVTGTAVATQTDPAMAGAVALSVLAACAGGRLEVEAKPGWREPVNAYVATFAGPGERKTPVHHALVRALYAAQKTLAQKAAPAIAESTALKDIASRTAEQARTVAAKADPDRRDEMTAEAVAAVLAAEAITVPGMPRLVADDATPEALVGLMAANGGRIAVLSDEGGIFDTLAGRYSGTPWLDPYLKGYSGRPMSTDRLSRATETIDRPALTVGVMAQPSVLKEFGGNTKLVGRGLLARFWLIMPRSYAGWRDQDAPAVAEHVTARYDATVHELAATLAEWTDPAVVTLQPDAAAIRAQAAAELETQLRPGADLADMPEWANKLPGTMVRLAGLLHVAHHPAGAWRTPISATTMRDAVQLTHFLIAHYKAAMSTMASDETSTIARKVLETLTTKGMTVFTRRDLHRRMHRQLPKADDVAAVLAVLASHGWIRTGPDGRHHLHPDTTHYLTSGPDQPPVTTVTTRHHTPATPPNPAGPAKTSGHVTTVTTVTAPVTTYPAQQAQPRGQRDRQTVPHHPHRRYP
jgi:replicative DNA helicase